MADFKVGSTTIADMKVGSTQIQAVYVGSSLVWSAGTDVDYRTSATAAGSSYPSTSNINVYTTDYLVGWNNGKQTQGVSGAIQNGTATISSWSNIASELGDSGNDILLDVAAATVSSAGTLGLESYVQYAGLGFIAVSDADSYSASHNSSAYGASIPQVSVSNCTSNDLMIIIHSIQDLQRNGYYYPTSSPSGYTQLVQQAWLSGQGGAAQYWTTTVWYKEGGSGTESFTGSSSGDYNAVSIMRIYAA